MATSFTLWQILPNAQLLNPAADAAGRTGTWVSLKTCHKAWVVFHLTQGSAATILLSLLQAQDVSGTGSKVFANAVPTVANLDQSVSDALMRQTDAVNYTTDAGVKNKIVIFEIDPAMLDTANNFRTVTVSTGASNAANITAAQIFLATRYEQVSPPSMLVN